MNENSNVNQEAGTPAEAPLPLIPDIATRLQRLEIAVFGPAEKSPVETERELTFDAMLEVIRALRATNDQLRIELSQRKTYGR